MTIHARWIHAALVTSILGCGIAAGAGPFGPPRAVIGYGRWTVGLEYGRQTADMESSGFYKEGYVDDTVWYSKDNRFILRDVESNTILGRIEYGLGDTWDLFARLGVSDMQADLAVPLSGSDGLPATQYFGGGEEFSLDHSAGLALGVGSRMTFVETGDLSLGTVFQFTWLKPSSSDVSFTDTDLVGDPIAMDLTVDLDCWEIQLAGGATLNLGNLWLYGGPFLSFIRGNLDIHGTWTDLTLGSGSIRAAHDLQEDAVFGGYVGGQWILAENLCVHMEGQFTQDGWGIAAGGVWRLD
ncbi:MAG: hypothetical protein KBE04_14500 [Phycisphaerae bacterium]|nr:hypothetical protein [Phycisphaerae bacterium]